MTDLATLFANLEAAVEALRPLDGDDALSDETLALVSDLRLALASEQRRIADHVEAEWQLSPDYEVDGQLV
jgi:hypothetical protein